MPSPRYWREIPARYRLQASRCKSCGMVVYPARRVCRSCRSTESEDTTLSRRGKVISWTMVHVAPEAFVMQTPYAMALVETPEKARLMVQLVDCDAAQLCCGMDVTLEFRRISGEGRAGILCYGHKAVPARQD